MLWAKSIDRVRAAFEDLALVVGNQLRPFCDRSELWLHDHPWVHTAIDFVAALAFVALCAFAIYAFFTPSQLP